MTGDLSSSRREPSWTNESSQTATNCVEFYAPPVNWRIMDPGTEMIRGGYVHARTCYRSANQPAAVVRAVSRMDGCSYSCDSLLGFARKPFICLCELTTYGARGSF